MGAPYPKLNPKQVPGLYEIRNDKFSVPLRLRGRAGGAEQLEVPERPPEATERPK